MKATSNKFAESCKTNFKQTKTNQAQNSATKHTVVDGKLRDAVLLDEVQYLMNRLYKLFFGDGHLSEMRWDESF